MSRLKAALIGSGAIAKAHINALRAHADQVTLKAVYNPHEASVADFAAQYGIAPYTNLEEMLRAIQPDIVLITSPPAVHLEQCVACLEAGAWVLCEKPLVGSLADFDRISATETATGAYVSTVFQWRFGSMARHIHQLMQRGAFGRLLLGLTETLWFRDAAYYDVYWRGTWQNELGGTAMVHGVHLMDLLLWLKGDWEEVSAQIATRQHNIEVEDVALGWVRFADGTLISTISSAVSPRQESYMRLDFEKATVEVRGLYEAANVNWRLSLPPGIDNAEITNLWESVPDDVPGIHAPQVGALLAAYERGERPSVSGDDGRRPLEFLAHFYKSAFSGRPVRRGEVTPDDPFYFAMNGQPK